MGINATFPNNKDNCEDQWFPGPFFRCLAAPQLEFKFCQNLLISRSSKSAVSKQRIVKNMQARGSGLDRS